MKQVVLKSLGVAATAFTLFLLLVLLVLNEVPVKRNNGKTAFLETRLFQLKNNPQHYDVLIVGSSRAVQFSEHVNNDSLEIILGKKTTNISHVGAGIIPMNMMLRYFYESGNTADHIIRFVDNHEFYSRYANEQCNFLQTEPFDLNMLQLAVEEGLAFDRYFGYAQSKYRSKWLNMTSLQPDYRFLEQMDHADSVAIAKRMKILYPDGEDTLRFPKYKADFYHFVDIASQHNSKVTFVMPPHLLGPQPGHERVLQVLDSIKQDKGIEYYDYSDSINDVSLFANHDHLNTPGTVYMMQHYLKPIVSED